MEKYYTGTNDKEFEDYSYLDNILEKDFIPNHIKIKRKIDRKTGDIDVFASISLFEIQKLGLNEYEIKHVIGFLNERDIQVFGKNITFASEFENYHYIINYKHSKLPESVDWDTQLQWFIKYNELKKDPTKINDAKNIRNEIVKSNMKLVPFINYKFAMSYGFDIDELNSYGYEALINTVDKFDYTKGYKFSTYAYKAIERSVLRNKAKEMGFYSFKKYLQVEDSMKLIKDYYDEMGFEEDVVKKEVIALLNEKYGYTKKEAESAFNRHSINSAESIYDYKENEMESEDYDEKEELLDSDLSLDEQIDITLIEENLQTLLENLTPRQRFIIKQRFGFLDGIPKSLEEIASELNITIDRVRHIEKKSMSKIIRLSKRNDAFKNLL